MQSQTCIALVSSQACVGKSRGDPIFPIQLFFHNPALVFMRVSFRWGVRWFVCISEARIRDRASNIQKDLRDRPENPPCSETTQWRHDTFAYLLFSGLTPMPLCSARAVSACWYGDEDGKRSPLYGSTPSARHCTISMARSGFIGGL